RKSPYKMIYGKLSKTASLPVTCHQLHLAHSLCGRIHGKSSICVNSDLATSKEIADKRNVNVSKGLFVLFLRGFLKFLPILAHAFLPVRQCDCQGLQKSPGLVRQARPSSIENSRSSPWG